MSNIQLGTIKKILTKDWGNKTLYSVVLNETDKIYGLGAFRIKAKPGDSIKFESTVNAKGYPEINTKTLEVTENKEATHVGVTAQSAVRGSNGLSKDDYWGRKELRDLRQDELREIGATRNTAVEWIKFLMEKEALKLPVKVADREASLNALLDDYVNKFRGIGKTAPAKAKETTETNATAATGDTWDNALDAS